MRIEMARRVLIVSPHFPPVNAPDMHRVRTSLPHFREFGWEPSVLAVEPSSDACLDPVFERTVPPDIPVERVATMPASMTRLMGIGNAAIRALPQLKAAGDRLLSTHDFDLVFFSTTMFAAMPLGRLWKRRFGVPFVLDIQDPWVTDYYETHPEVVPPRKYGVMRRIHARLEPWTMREVDGLMAVSAEYLTMLTRRYPRLADVPRVVLPFAAATEDLAWLAKNPQPNPHFAPSGTHSAPGDRAATAERVHGVFTGHVLSGGVPALRILFAALQHGLAHQPDLFGAVALHFIGTDYAAQDRARPRVAPLAAQFEVSHLVSEQVTRVPYFQALQATVDADFLLITGSDDPDYVPSKLGPYLLTGRPILAIVHDRSAALSLLRSAGAHIATFATYGPGEAGSASERAAATALAGVWARVLDGTAPPSAHAIGMPAILGARETTGHACALFDEVVARHERARADKCA